MNAAFTFMFAIEVIMKIFTYGGRVRLKKIAKSVIFLIWTHFAKLVKNELMSGIKCKINQTKIQVTLQTFVMFVYKM